jgi:TRAP-type C4-dicarboxylate transport system permease small subunit
MADERSQSSSSLPKRGAIVSVRLDGLPEKRPHQWAPDHWPAPVRWLTVLSHWLAIAEGVGIGFCLLAVVFLATWQFVDRNLVQHHFVNPDSGFGKLLSVPGWTDGVIRHSVFLLGFLGGAYATYTGRHIRIDAVTRVLKPQRRMLLRAVTTLAALAIVVIFVKAGWGFYQVTLEETGEASQAGQLFTPARGALIMVIGYAVIAFHFLVQIVLDVSWLISKDTPPPEWIAEATHGETPAAPATPSPTGEGPGA